jgi:hypothetical protein
MRLVRETNPRRSQKSRRKIIERDEILHEEVWRRRVNVSLGDEAKAPQYYHWRNP